MLVRVRSSAGVILCGEESCADYLRRGFEALPSTLIRGKPMAETRNRDSWLRLRRIDGSALHGAAPGSLPASGGHEPGGQLSITTLVENFPAGRGGNSGAGADRQHQEQARALARSISTPTCKVSQVRPIKLRTSAGELHARTLIVASGASARWLGPPSEQALIGHGVSSCATCDGFFFRDKWTLQ